MACSTGDACGFTDTRSSARSSLNQSAVIRLTIDALEAWCPPTFTPERFSRTRLAWCTIAADSHSTRRSMALSVSRSGAAGRGDGFVVVGEPLMDSDLPIPEGEEDHEGHHAFGAARHPTVPPGAGRHDPVAVSLDRPHLDDRALPNGAPFLHALPDTAVALPRTLLGPVGSVHHPGVVGVEVDGALDVAGVPPLGQLADEFGVVHVGLESGPCTHLRSSSPGVPAGRRLRPGWSAAHERYRLRLLPPGSDLVRERSPRGTRPSTPLSGVLAPKAEALGREFGPARADCGCRAPLPPRLARSAPKASAICW